MKTAKNLLVAGLILISTVLNAQQLNVNTTESVVNWKGEQVTHFHVGTINVKEGTVTLEDNKLTGATIVMDISSIETSDVTGMKKGMLEKHLKSDDFFDAKAFPTATLKSTNVEELAANKYLVSAEITIKDVTETVEFEAMFNDNGESMVATAKFTIDRAKHNVKYKSGSFFDELGDKLIYDEIPLDIKLVVSK